MKHVNSGTLLATLKPQHIEAIRAATAKTLEKQTLAAAVNEAKSFTDKAVIATVQKVSALLAKYSIPMNSVQSIEVWVNEGKVTTSVRTPKVAWASIPIEIPKAVAVKEMPKADAPKIVITRESVLAPATAMKIRLIGGTDEDRATIEALVREIHKGDTLAVGAEVDPTVAELARDLRVQMKLVPVY